MKWFVPGPHCGNLNSAAILCVGRNAGFFWNRAMQLQKGTIHSRALEGLGALLKLGEEEDVWPGWVGIGPKAWGDKMGMGKELWGLKG